MPEISPAESAPGESPSRLDPRTKLLALLVLNALVMRASPTTTLIAVQVLVVAALAWEVSVKSALRIGFGCLICDVIYLGSPLLVTDAVSSLAASRGAHNRHLRGNHVLVCAFLRGLRPSPVRVPHHQDRTDESRPARCPPTTHLR